MDFRQLLFSKRIGNGKPGSAHCREQPSKEADDHRKYDALDQQRQGYMKGKGDLAETGEVQRGRGKAVEGQPCQAGSDGAACPRELQ